MKKFWLIVTMLVLVLALVACTDSTGTTATTTTGTPDSTPALTTTGTAAVTTVAPTTTTATPTTTTSAPVTTTAAPTTTTAAPTTTVAPGTTAVPDEKLEVAEDYTAVLNDAKWENKTDIDTSKFEYFGTGSKVAAELSKEFNGITRTWFLQNADGTVEKSSYSKVRTLGTIAANVKKVDAENVEITVVEVVTLVQPSWTKVTAKAGTYLMFDFTTNMDMDFYMTVTRTKGGAANTAAYKQGGVSVTKVGPGEYTGVAKCTVPYHKGTTFYINICVDEGKEVLASIPVDITEAKYDSEYSLMFQGDWELIKHDDYLDNLIDLFYNVYPRLYARFAFGTEPKQITFMADKNYDGVAYCAGTVVCVSVDYANGNPNDLGFFSHEITHSVQQYGHLNYGDDGQNGFKAWWTENMANYGGFRYFHWGYSPNFVQVFNVHANEESIWNWGYQAYGNNKVFFAYMDWKYPTLDTNKDGKITVDEYGLIDAINYMIKTATSKMYDTPNDPNTKFNKKVAEVTNGEFDCIEALRQQFEKDCKAKVWDFNGFRDYPDNFRTENLPGIPNPNYPMKEIATPSATTHNKLTTPVTEGENLALGGTISSTTAKNDKEEYVSSNLIDGDLTTRFEAKKSSGLYKLSGVENEIIIDLGAVKSFNTYTMVNAGAAGQSSLFNTGEWEIFVSADGSTYTAVDYQTANKDDIVSVNIGDQSARYIKIRLYDSGSAGKIRLYEFMVFKAD